MLPMGISAQTHMQHRPSLDTVGATASLACAVHCAVVALLFGALPAASLLAAPWIDWAFLGASTAIGLFALVPGYRRHHLRTPLVLFTIGITILTTLRVLRVPPSIAEMIVVLFAASLLIVAHWKNRSAVHTCEHR